MGVELIIPIEELKKSIRVNLKKSESTNFLLAFKEQDGQTLICSFDNKMGKKKEIQVLKLNNDVFSLNRKVKDQLRFIITPTGEIYDSSVKNLENIDNSLKILMILESPHKDEYYYSYGYYSIRPANGKTGKKIKKHIKQVLSNIKKLNEANSFEYCEKYIEIVIMNRICYQTSLGSYYSEKLRKPLRNNIFKVLWEEENIQKDFKERLLKQKVHLVINACTKEVDEDDCYFSNFILDVLKKNNRNTLLFESRHPMYWETDSGIKRIN
ncbi:hypothetical protein [Lysinibacillus xylanilyticus]|uniref:Uncharacterized protein n=1 Tax=Lysinibacillus xylanilyticus TaxID=582475 RepID=A0ABV3VQ98_9BACI